MPTRRGFTLIELLMIVAILAVLAAVGAPACGSLLGRTRAQTARDGLVAALDFARQTAVARRARVIVCPSTDAAACERTTRWQQGWLVFADLDGDGRRGDGEPVLATGQAQPAGVAILGTEGRPLLRYQPDGSAGGSNLRLIVCDRAAGASAATKLAVNLAGRVRRETASPADAAACLRAAGQEAVRAAAS